MPTRTWRGTSSALWSLAANWAELSVPTSSDDVVFDVSSPACTINTANRVALSIDFTNYANTITMTYGITSYGNITLGVNMSFGVGTGFLNCIGNSATLRSNTKHFPNAMLLAGTYTPTYVLYDDWYVGGVLTLGTNNKATTINGNTIYAASDLYITCSSGWVTGTTAIVMNGTGKWHQSAGTLEYMSLTFNTAGDITIEGAVSYYGGVLTYVTAHSMTVAGSTLQLNGSNTLDLRGITLNNVSFLRSDTAYTTTLTTGFVVAGKLTVDGVNKSLVSSTPGVQQVVTLLQGGTQDIFQLNVTDVDSSAGMTLWSFKGTLSNATNWKTLTAPMAASSQIF